MAAAVSNYNTQPQTLTLGSGYFEHRTEPRAFDSQPFVPTLQNQEQPQDKALYDTSFTEYPCSIEQVDVIELQPQPPTLTIEEQPTQFYRFRYESEIEKDSSRVGGLLLGRNSTNYSKSFIKVRIDGIVPDQHSQIRLIVCTVNSEDKAPHPYYLHGDNCNGGYFEVKKSVDTADKGSASLEINFERLAVICVPKKNKKEILKYMEERRRNVPKLADCPETPSTEYSRGNLGRIRLAFSVSFTDTRGINWQLSTEVSDEIISDKEKKNIEVDCLNPGEVPTEGGCTIAIHTVTATTGIQKNAVKVHFIVTNDDKEEKIVFVQDVFEMNKHLLIAKTPDLTHISAGIDRLKGVVVVHSNGFKSEEINIIFSRAKGASKTQGVGNGMKRLRT